MTWQPRSSLPLRTANPVRRGRFNLLVQESGGGLLAGDADGAPGGGSAPPTVPLADLHDAVDAYTAAHMADFANHCSDFVWLDGLIAHLQGIDERVGACYRPERDDFPQDAVVYYHGTLPPVEDSPDVYVVDVIFSKCTVDAEPTWNDVTTPAALRLWRSVRT